MALGSMSSVMAHELRNPLASLKGHAQLLLEDLEAQPEDARRRAKAERVVAEAERIEVLTSHLLDFVRDGPIERVRLTPRELAERALADLARDRIDVALGGAPEVIFADPGRLARAVHNLVDNALQADPDGRVTLAIRAAGAGMVLTVRDHGPGLPDGIAIFEPFMTTRVRGTGLGLAVARRIAEQHGGQLEGANDPDRGAIFTLTLPSTGATP